MPYAPRGITRLFSSVLIVSVFWIGAFLFQTPLAQAQIEVDAQDFSEEVDGSLTDSGSDLESDFLLPDDASATSNEVQSSEQDAYELTPDAPASEYSSNAEEELTPEQQSQFNEEFAPPKEAPYSEEVVSSKPSEPAEPYRPYDGLKKVTAKGEYLYNVKTSPQHWAGRFRVMAFAPQELANTLENGSKLYFDEIYDTSSSLMFNIEMEYQLIQGLGKLGITAGTGFFNATGNGRFKETPTRIAREEYNFYLMPNSLGAVYRLELWNRQPVVPYGFAKGYYFTFAETRDDNDPIKYGGALATGFGGGAALLLDFFDQHAINQLDNDSGVNHIYLVAEYEMIVGANTNFDFSTEFFSAGILVEF